MAIGWSGQWSADVSANYSGSADSPNTNFRLRAGIPNLQIQLQPGEEIAGPVILIGNYKGQLAGGSNQLRRLIRNHYTPRLDGVELGMTRRYDTWTNIHEHYSESMLRPIVDTAAQLQQQYFILDAAWYEGCNGPRGFSGGVGNWHRVDREKFSNGLAPAWRTTLLAFENRYRAKFYCRSGGSHAHAGG